MLLAVEIGIESGIESGTTNFECVDETRVNIRNASEFQTVNDDVMKYECYVDKNNNKMSHI